MRGAGPYRPFRLFFCSVDNRIYSSHTLSKQLREQVSPKNSTNSMSSYYNGWIDGPRQTSCLELAWNRCLITRSAGPLFCPFFFFPLDDAKSSCSHPSRIVSHSAGWWVIPRDVVGSRCKLQQRAVQVEGASLTKSSVYLLVGFVRSFSTSLALHPLIVFFFFPFASLCFEGIANLLSKTNLFLVYGKPCDKQLLSPFLRYESL